jgi:serum/glucocorticoid-regulated kinase 2
MLFNSSKKEICIEDFDQLKVLGQGAFGKVVLAQKKDNKKIYAVKILKKKEVLETGQLEHTLAEKMILSHINHPFLVGLEYAFQTDERIYFVMEFMKGGEMFQHMTKLKRFSEKQCKFYAACVILGLGHLHTKNYIYRDLKLENILLDEHGYAKLTDFGLAKFIQKEDKALTFCGTPEYLAPEVILGQGHNRPADWWSLGILIYEMVHGLPPFYDQNVNNMYNRIIKNVVQWKPNINISPECKSIIKKLLHKDPIKRLGSEADSLEVLSHEWFEDLDWSSMMEKKLPSPYVPSTSGTDWLANFDSDFTCKEVRDTHLPKDMNAIKEIQKYKDEFDQFNYNIDEAQKEEET